MKFLGFYVALIMFPVSGANAQTTDLAAAVTSILNSFGPVPVTTTTSTQVRQCRWIYHRPRQDGMEDPPTCDPYYVAGPSQSHTDNKLLTASNIRIVAVQPISWGAMVATNLPNEVYADSILGPSMCELSWSANGGIQSFRFC